MKSFVERSQCNVIRIIVTNFILLFITLIFLPSCNLFEKPEGCTGKNALNYDFEADRDDGSCSFSNVIFYGGQFSPCPPVVVQVDGNAVGNIEAAYPTGPGNCSVPGVAKFAFKSGDQVDWIATDACGFIFSGIISPSSREECISIKVF